MSHTTDLPSLPRHIKVGIVLFPIAFPLDWCGPLDILNTLRPSQPLSKEVDLSIRPILLAESMEPVEMTGGWKVDPQMTFEQARAEAEGEGGGWDAILVPGGQGVRPWMESGNAAREFIREVGKGCKVLLTVCTGSWLLAQTGLLDGYKATTNKASYKTVVEHTANQDIQWVPKARWVVDQHIWTASGVSAGIDMASAFLRYFLSMHLSAEDAKKYGDKLLGVLEVIENEQTDDPWAGYYQLDK